MVRLAPGLIALLLFAAAPAFAQRQGPFTIVVLAGEDSVNVIQQKTAVAPLVEVRDRNNNPVSGVAVTFAVQGGKAAAFQGGAATMTVATNAAGQAVAAGFTPLTAGAVNISIEAAIQGQVVTAAITQVNVLTAAEAAAAAGATSAGSSGTAAGGGAAGGAGGGISATTIGIIGGVAAAGAVAGTQVLGGAQGGQAYSGTFAMRATVSLGLASGVITCTRDEVFGGTLEVELEGSDSVSGEARIKDAYKDIVVNNCGGSIGPDGSWGMSEATVRGSSSALAFEASDSVPARDGSGPINRVYKFNGSITGDTITGTFELSMVHQVQPYRFLGSQQITLQKQ